MPKSTRLNYSAIIGPGFPSEQRRLDVAIPRMVAAKPNLNKPDPIGVQSSVLIVDDEAVNRLVLEGYLGHHDYNITECSTGAEALELIHSAQHFDLVLLDVMMPGLSGYEVCEKIRKQFDLIDLPVIFLTAKSQVADMARGYQVGANDFLFKPVIREEFLAKIQVHLQLIAKYRAAMSAMKS